MVRVMVFNATFNNSIIFQLYRGGRVYLGGKPLTSRKSLTNFITNFIEHTSLAGFELTTLVVIDTDCKGFCKYNYHTIMTTTATLTTGSGVYQH